MQQVSHVFWEHLGQKGMAYKYQSLYFLKKGRVEMKSKEAFPKNQKQFFADQKLHFPLQQFFL